MEGADRHGIELNAVQMRELESGQHALVEMLSRSELKALLKPAQEKFTSSQKPSEKSLAAKQQDTWRGQAGPPGLVWAAAAASRRRRRPPLRLPPPLQKN